MESIKMNCNFLSTQKTWNVIIITLSLILIVIGIYLYSNTKNNKYNEKFIIGKSVEEIVKKYGNYERIAYSDVEQKYVSFIRYIVKPKETGYLGTTEAWYCWIYFDENGSAKSFEIRQNW